jgi:hypothetical protein
MSSSHNLYNQFTQKFKALIQISQACFNIIDISVIHLIHNSFPSKDKTLTQVLINGI